MPDATVTLTRCGDYGRGRIAEAMQRQFELLGGLGKYVKPGDTVLLKPNFIAPRARRHATQTDPAIILEAARLLKDFGAKPFVADSPAWSDTFTCAKVLGLTEPLAKMSVPVRQLDNPRGCTIGARQTKVGISTVALDADVIINLPKFKSHQQLGATFAVKNMFGCVAGKRKALWHFAKGGNPADFCELLIDIYGHLKPALTIIDGVLAMDGPGPIRGRARPLGWLIGGADPIACETICANLVGIEPETLPIIKTARQIGFGCLDRARIEITGDGFPQEICTDFELPELIPIRFTLLHVCKSICKQIMLLAKSSRKASS
ncbi:MAG: DUF362 domain-containing protein [Phycisphaerales bacterium]|nr:MAG: DUF362 domain-containing protein [Phycisphaerales bacterium]